MFEYHLAWYHFTTQFSCAVISWQRSSIMRAHIDVFIGLKATSHMAAPEGGETL